MPLRKHYLCASLFLSVVLVYGLVFDDTNAVPTGLTQIFSAGSDQISAMFPVHLSPVYFAFLLIYYALVHFLGCSVLGRLVRSSGTELPFPVRLGSAFFTGYFVTVAVNRIVSLILPMVIASYAAPVALLALAVVLHQKSNQQFRFAKAALVFSVYLCMVGLMLVQHVYNGYHFLAGDSTQSWVDFLTSQIRSPDASGRLPFVFYHYDEIAFNFPLVFVTSAPPIDLKVLFWLVNGVGAASAFYFALFVLQLFAVERWLAFAAAIFLFWGTCALNPTQYLLLFDSDNPLFFCVHLGRIAGALFPMAIVGLLNQFDSVTRSERPPYLCLALIMAGLAATSMHNLIYCSLFGVWFVLVKTLDWRPPRWVNPAVAAVLSCPFFVYSARPFWTPEETSGYPLVAGILVCSIITVAGVTWRSSKSHSTGQSFKLLAVGLLGGFLSWLFLGNGLVGAGRAVLEASFGRFGFIIPEVWTRPVKLFDRGLSLFQFTGCHSAENPDIPESPLKHCTSNSSFIGFFALIFFMLFSAVWLSERERREAGKNRAAEMLISLGVLASGLFCFAFLVKDFVITSKWDWYFSRFLEGPYYASVILFFAAIQSSVDLRGRRMVGLAAVVWSVLPFVLMYRPEQWLENLRFLFGDF